MTHPPHHVSRVSAEAAGFEPGLEKVKRAEPGRKILITGLSMNTRRQFLPLHQITSLHEQTKPADQKSETPDRGDHPQLGDIGERENVK